MLTQACSLPQTRYDSDLELDATSGVLSNSDQSIARTLEPGMRIWDIQSAGTVYS